MPSRPPFHRVGNSKFLKLFRWLVASNYRIVHSAGLLFNPTSQPYDDDPAEGAVPIESAGSTTYARTGSGHRKRRVYSVINEAAGTHHMRASILHPCRRIY